MNAVSSPSLGGGSPISAHFVLACLLLPISCAGSSPPASAANREQALIMNIYQSRCGACHEPVQPGTRSSDALNLALARHRKRVRLTERQWSELVRFLATRGI
jgi:hypothetical protein